MEKLINDLVNKSTREELDAIALSYGIDATDLKTKKEVAEAIVKAIENKGAELDDIELNEIEVLENKNLTNEEVMKVAKACHEVNKAFCESHGDKSQVSWEMAPGWQKRSAYQGVKIRLLNPETTSKQLHDSWMEAKKEDGWKYGEVKDPEAKTHPCMVKYEELPEDQKAKDILFGAVVDSFRKKC